MKHSSNPSLGVSGQVGFKNGGYENSPTTAGRRPTSQSSSPSDNHPATGSGVRGYVRDIERAIIEFQRGQSSRVEAIGKVANLLASDTELSEKSRNDTFQLYLKEIDSVVMGDDEDSRGAVGKQGKVKGRAQGHLTDDNLFEVGDKRSRELSSDLEAERGKRKKRYGRLKESDMPWYDMDVTEGGVERRARCEKSYQLLRKFSGDISGAKSLARLAPTAPSGVPTSQWERIFRGEAVDLDHFLSSLYRITVDEERVGRVGETRISLGSLEAERKVTNGAEWSDAWMSAKRAVAFAFPHRKQELEEYGRTMRRHFASKHSSSHTQLILYDIAVRNEVGGGQVHLLTDTKPFERLWSAIMSSDGVLYTTSGNTLMDVCDQFNTDAGCDIAVGKCRFKHVCKACGESGHNRLECRDQEWEEGDEDDDGLEEVDEIGADD